MHHIFSGFVEIQVLNINEHGICIRFWQGVTYFYIFSI
jgi:hypothetical protein